jgi:alkylation response protein AidB-like acyl-CoA dehydrogenase
VKLDFDPEMEAFRAEVREFFQNALTDDLRAARAYMTSVYCDDVTSRAWQKILYDKGWLVPSWPEEYGGTGWSLTQRYVFACESARAGPPPISPMGIGMLGPALLGCGTEAQKQHYLPRMLRGEDFWCQGYSEPQAGSDLARLATRARIDGDDYVVTGTKIWTTHAHYANRMFCLVRTGEFARPQEGVTFLLMDMEAPGVSTRPIRFYSGDHEQCQVFFDEVRVPRRNAVGDEHKGWAVTKYLLEFERGGGAVAPGLLLGLERLQRRLAPADGLPGEADLARRADALDAAVRAMEALELRCLAETERTGSPGPSASMLKIRATELSQALSALNVEAAGYYGLPWQQEAIDQRGAVPPLGALGAESADAVAAPFYFNNRAATIYGGSNEIQRNIIAKRVLGL